MDAEGRPRDWGLTIVNIVGVTICGGFLAALYVLVLIRAFSHFSWGEMGLVALPCWLLTVFRGLRQKRPIVSVVGSAMCTGLFWALYVWGLVHAQGPWSWAMWGFIVASIAAWIWTAASRVRTKAPAA